MPTSLYTDVHVPMAITRGLRRRGFNVLTAQDDNASRLADPQLLDRCLELQRILFTQDEDFLAEAAQRQKARAVHATVVFAHQFEPIGKCIADLALILEVATPEETRNHILYIPL